MKLLIEFLKIKFKDVTRKGYEQKKFYTGGTKSLVKKSHCEKVSLYILFNKHIKHNNKIEISPSRQICHSFQQ